MTITADHRHVESADLVELVDPATNADVCEYLAKNRPSCHSDVGSALLRSADKCGEWVAFSPSFRRNLYVALVTNRSVFALGLGQGSVLYRLPERLRATALATGATQAPDVGANWVRFELFRPDWPTPDLAFWTLSAYSAARANHE